MSKYEIQINKRARKFISERTPKEQQRLLEAIYKLPEGDVVSLQGYKNAYRLRVGDYRVIYELYEHRLIIIVVNIGNRGQIYNRL